MNVASDTFNFQYEWTIKVYIRIHIYVSNSQAQGYTYLGTQIAWTTKFLMEPNIYSIITAVFSIHIKHVSVHFYMYWAESTK
jgi:hypothetical protein